MDKVLSSDENIRVLLIRIEEMAKELDNELAVNEKLADQNIELKKHLAEIKNKTKVIPHPSTIKALADGLQDSEKRVEQLKEALLVSISLIPEVSVNRHMIDRLRRIAQSY